MNIDSVISKGFLQYQVIVVNDFSGSKVGLYRDDGLAIFRNFSGPNTDRIKKRIIKLFQTQFKNHH